MMHINSRLIQVMTAAMLVATLYSESQAQDAKKIPPAKPTKDVVTSVYNATTLPSGIVIKETNAGDYAYNQLLSSFNWSNSALYQIAHAIPDSKGCAGLVSNQAYIIHVAQWKVNSSESTLSLISSNWYAYREHDANNVAQVKEKPNKQPLLYAVKQALFVGLNFFDDDVDAKKLKVSYKVSATEAKADNVVALGQLLAAVMGLTVPAAGGESPNNTRLLVAAGCKTGTENLPFDFNVSFSLTAPDKSSNDGASHASASDQQHEQPQDTIRSEGGAASQGSGDKSLMAQRIILGAQHRRSPRIILRRRLTTMWWIAPRLGLRSRALLLELSEVMTSNGGMCRSESPFPASEKRSMRIQAIRFSEM
jgi:hypothetical protein